MIWGVIGIVAFLALQVAYHGGWMALAWQHHKGRFKIKRDDAHAFRFQTDFGVFTLDRRAKILRATGETQLDGIPFEWIDHVRFEHNTVVAQEHANGPSIWDWMERYSDVTHWYRITLICIEEPRRIPLFAVGQYEPKEPLMTRVYEAEAERLARLGLVEDASEKAEEVLTQIQGAFAASGHPITLTPEWVREKAAETARRAAAPPNPDR